MTPRKIDYRGAQIGRLTVLEEAGVGKNGAIIWKVRCRCGSEKNMASHNLKRSYSCGCFRAEVSRLPTTERKRAKEHILL